VNEEAFRAAVQDHPDPLVAAAALDLCLRRPTALPSRRRDCSMATEGEGFRRRLVRFATEQFNVEHPVDRDRRGGPQPQ